LKKFIFSAAISPFKNFTIATFLPYPSILATIPKADDDLPLPLPVSKTIKFLSIFASTIRLSIMAYFLAICCLYFDIDKLLNYMCI
jgi:hypothetical protein